MRLFREPLEFVVNAVKQLTTILFLAFLLGLVFGPSEAFAYPREQRAFRTLSNNTQTSASYRFGFEKEVYSQGAKLRRAARSKRSRLESFSLDDFTVSDIWGSIKTRLSSIGSFLAGLYEKSPLPYLFSVTPAYADDTVDYVSHTEHRIWKPAKQALALGKARKSKLKRRRSHSDKGSYRLFAREHNIIGRF